MVQWHETRAAQFGLRIGGLAVLSAAWATGVRLYAQVHSHPPASASFGELVWCTLLVVLLVAGNALLFVGPGLWKQVEIPARWSAALIEPRQFDVLLERQSRNLGDFSAIKLERACPIGQQRDPIRDTRPSRSQHG